jgi:hypothetical protein
MADKDKLQAMLDSLIDNKDETAQVHFHSYLEDKMKEVLHPQVDKKESDDKQD